ncbi:MAG TPA: HAD-IA family hydrolase [Xanthobacteraceae bacterium]|nr:HAD-IA family hydrolase [Xanthobacteraceae bacterium]
MFEAVIWDFGGVFTASPFEAFATFERARGLPKDFVRRVNATNHLENAWARLERAEIDHDTFDELFAAECRALGQEVRGRDVLPLLFGEARPAMAEALRRIHARLKTGCITNNLPAGGGNPMASMYKSDIMVHFDHVIESAKIGLRKPDPRIYQMMVAALEVAPAACIYLDDLGVNLKPARAMGMATIKVVDPDVALAELAALVGFALR